MNIYELSKTEIDELKQVSLNELIEQALPLKSAEIIPFPGTKQVTAQKPSGCKRAESKLWDGLF